jgi:uncharacterized protein
VAFEFDETKSQANKEKHGVDFLEAQELWKDENALEAFATSLDEPRFLRTVKHEGRHWLIVCTRRGDNIRLISVRRAGTKEMEAYED